MEVSGQATDIRAGVSIGPVFPLCHILYKENDAFILQVGNMIPGGNLGPPSDGLMFPPGLLFPLSTGLVTSNLI